MELSQSGRKLYSDNLTSKTLTQFYTNQGPNQLPEQWSAKHSINGESAA